MAGRRPGGGSWTRFAVLALAIQAVLIVVTFTDYGMTRDEPYAADYGSHALAWYASGFKDREVLAFRERGQYSGLGVFFDATTQAIAYVSPLGRMETRHLVNALYGLLAAAGAFALGHRIGGPRVGALAALFLILTPRFYGHSFNNPKDVPFAALGTWGLYFLLRALASGGAWRWVLAFGTAAGLALGIRVGGVILLGYAALVLLALVLGRGGAPRPDSGPKTARRLIPRFIAAGLLAYAIMLLFWPAAQVSPIRHPWWALRLAADFPWNHTVFFEGAWTPAHDLPWHYIPKWMAIATPEFLLFGLLAMGALAVRRWIGRTRASEMQPPFADRPGLWLVAWAALLPPVLAVLTDASTYDGMRHLLFVVPPLTVLAATGISRLLDVSTRIPRIAIGALLAGALALTAADMIRLHPYQTTYFNRLVAGGLPRAALAYETDYWGNAYMAGAKWIDANYQSAGLDRRIRVASCFRPATLYYLPEERFQHVPLDRGDPADVFIASTRWDCHLARDGQVVHTEARMGVPFLYVRDLEAGADSVRVEDDSPPDSN